MAGATGIEPVTRPVWKGVPVGAFQRQGTIGLIGNLLPGPQSVTSKPPEREKLNAVRAAFKAGVKPSQIAWQFGLAQADVRKALASDASRRGPDRG
jgi:hypothetical protein